MEQQVLALIQEVVDELNSQLVETKITHRDTHDGRVYHFQGRELNKTYLEKIQPRLAAVTYSLIASALSVSQPYAADIRAGKRIPHPRNWQALAQLAGVSPEA